MFPQGMLCGVSSRTRVDRQRPRSGLRVAGRARRFASGGVLKIEYRGDRSFARVAPGARSVVRIGAGVRVSQLQCAAGGLAVGRGIDFRRAGRELAGGGALRVCLRGGVLRVFDPVDLYGDAALRPAADVAGRRRVGVAGDPAIAGKYCFFVARGLDRAAQHQSPGHRTGTRGVPLPVGSL